MTGNDPAPADFRQFFERSYPRVLAWALMRCGNRHDAEDAVQEAYARALRHWDRVGGYDCPDAWVFLVVRQQLQKASYRWRRSSSLEAMELDAWPPAPGGTEHAAEARAVLTALAGLPDRYRVVLTMYCVLGMDQQAIAEELGLTANAVRQRVFKARRALEKVLGHPAQAHHDALTTATGPVPFGAGTLPADRTGAMLRAAHGWLREGIEVNERAGERLYRAVLARAARDRSR